MRFALSRSVPHVDWGVQYSLLDMEDALSPLTRGEGSSSPSSMGGGNGECDTTRVHLKMMVHPYVTDS